MKNVMLILSLLFLNFLTLGQAGPLIGSLVINKGEINARWDDKIEYVFKVKNAGKDPINVLKIITSCECQDADPNNVQTIQPGKYGNIKIKVLISEDQLKNGLKEGNGVINYDKSVIVETNGKKRKYQLYTRAKIRIID